MEDTTTTTTTLSSNDIDTDKDSGTSTNPLLTPPTISMSCNYDQLDENVTVPVTSEEGHCSLIPSNTTTILKKPSKSKSIVRKIYKENYSSAILKVLEQIHGSIYTLEIGTMDEVNGILNYIFDRVAGEAGNLAEKSGKKTISVRDIKAAVNLVFGSGELALHAVREGDKAVLSYEKSLENQ